MHLRHTRHLHLILLAAAILGDSPRLTAQPLPQKKASPTPQDGVAVPASVAAFIKAIEREPSHEQFVRIAKRELWNVYPLGKSARSELVQYVSKGPAGPGLAFAALALVPFHEPADAEVLAKRAIEPKLPSNVRWHFLNTAPYILAMGDVWHDGEGKLDKDAREMIAELAKGARVASQKGLGRWHASKLRELYDTPKKERERNPDSSLLLWHMSAYLVGTLDLRDYDVLFPLYDYNLGGVLPNLMNSLSHASGRDFEVELRTEKGPNEEQLKRAIATAMTWWKAFLEKHPDGDWRIAAVSGLAEAGFATESDLKSAASRKALLNAIQSESSVVRYAAYRLLNEIYDTNFDLEIAFFAGKYAMSPYDPSPEAATNAARLKEYWKKRLSSD